MKDKIKSPMQNALPPVPSFLLPSTSTRRREEMDQKIKELKDFLHRTRKEENKARSEVEITNPI